jgi:hypothetical protein
MAIRVWEGGGGGREGARGWGRRDRWGRSREVSGRRARCGVNARTRGGRMGGGGTRERKKVLTIFFSTSYFLGVEIEIEIAAKLHLALFKKNPS